MNKHQNKKRSLWYEWFESILVALILAVFIRTFFLEPYKIPTTSMVPTLMPRDKILVSKIIYGPRIPFVGLRIPGFRKPKRGEVIVFIAPPEPNKCYVKRLIGLPGEKVSIRDGRIYINDKLITLPSIGRNFYYNRGLYGQEGGEIKVPADSYFVLGDNSALSRDSRYWGFVPYRNVVGKALVIWWPPRRFKLIY